MDDLDLDDLFLDAVETIILDALARIADDPRARYAFFTRLLAVAQEVAKERGQWSPWMQRFGPPVSTTA